MVIVTITANVFRRRKKGKLVIYYVFPIQLNGENANNLPVPHYTNRKQKAVWNIRSLHMAANMEEKLRRINIDILGLSEVRWLGKRKVV